MKLVIKTYLKLECFVYVTELAKVFLNSIERNEKPIFFNVLSENFFSFSPFYQNVFWGTPHFFLERKIKKKKKCFFLDFPAVFIMYLP